MISIGHAHRARYLNGLRLLINIAILVSTPFDAHHRTAYRAMHQKHTGVRRPSGGKNSAGAMKVSTSDTGDAGLPGPQIATATGEIARLRPSVALLRGVRPCGPDDPMLVLAYHDLDRQFDALLAALPKLDASDSADVVHRARNATRRIRSTLKAFRAILPVRPATDLATEMAWLADVLGRVRDLDVHRSAMKQLVAERGEHLAADIESYLRDVDIERAQARATLVGALATERFSRLLGHFTNFLDRGPPKAALRRSLGYVARDGATQLAVRGIRKLRKLGRRIDTTAKPEELHNFRIRCKRLRYQLESFEPVCGNGLHSAVKAVKRLQDTLGRYQDATVAIERLRHFHEATDASEELAPYRRALAELIRSQTDQATEANKRFQRDWRQFERTARPRRLDRKLRASSRPSKALRAT